jgi:hypothetical protein
MDFMANSVDLIEVALHGCVIAFSLMSLWEEKVTLIYFDAILGRRIFFISGSIIHSLRGVLLFFFFLLNLLPHGYLMAVELDRDRPFQ